MDPEESRSQPEETPATVVGIGGSAGAIESMEAVLLGLPAASGLSLAVILHGPPESAARLADVFARHTALAVRTGTLEDVRPDALVVVPAKREPAERPHGVDDLFAELARRYERRAVAVVLSGTGSDGGAGARAVEDAGGVVLVESPSTATYPAMPENAAAACARAESLPADRIGERLLELARSPLAGAADLDEQVRDILRLVRSRTGNDFSAYKPSTVLRRLERRLKAHGLTSLEQYRALLDRDGDEARELARDFAIGVTSFFRDPEAFEVLRTVVIPTLLRDRPADSPVRVWDACCASGEEAYTLAMLLAERVDGRTNVAPPQIFATDLDEANVAKGRAGRYPKTIAREVGGERLASFFTPVNGDYQAKRELRDLIVFARHNLLHDPPFSSLDLVVCRNFLIYLTPEVQTRILEMFHAMLRPGGYLFLGSSETLGGVAERFVAVDKRWRVFRRGAERHPDRPRALPGGDPKLFFATRPSEGGAPRPPSPTELAQQRLVERYAPPFVVVSEAFDVLHFSPGASRVCDVPVGEPTRNVVQWVRASLRPAVRAALHKAVQTSERAAFRAHLEGDGAAVFDVTAERLDASHPRGPLVLAFEPVAAPAAAAPAAAGAAQVGEDDKDRIIHQLEEQLRLSHEELSATIEQLATSNDGLVSTNEELMSVNEEFQSANEELETSREELQTVNEELTSVNQELQRKVEALDRANADISNLLDGTDIATLFLGRDLRVHRFTPGAAALFHLLPTDTGRPLTHLRSRIDYDRITEDASAVLSTERPVERDVATVDRARHYVMRLSPYRGAKGVVDGVVITFVDLTERRRMEEELREQARVLDLAHVMVRDLDDRIVLWNSGSAELYGFGREEAVGKVSHELLRTTFPRPLGELEAIVRRDGAWEGELVHRARDGRLVTVHSRWVLYRDAAGEPKRILETNADISARKAAEGRLRESERFARTILDSVDEGLVVLDREAKILVVNQAFLSLLGAGGTADAGVLGKRVTELDRGPPWLRAPGGPAGLLAGVLETATPREALEKHEDARGNEVYVELRAAPLRGDTAEIHSVLVTLRDVTERHELEERRLRAQKLEAIGTLAGGIAHDFNNLLQGITGYLALARHRLGEGQDAIEALAEAERATSLAAGLAGQLLAFAKGGKPTKKRLALGPIVEDAAKLGVSGSRAKLDLQIAPDLAGVEGDRTQLAQVVQNLVVNAVQAMPAGGVVHVSAANAGPVAGLGGGPHTAIVVRDAGKGIPPENLTRIFDPYFTTRATGSGLGLATVHAVARNHGGLVTVDSAVGKGSTFTVYLPAAKAPRASETPDAAPGPAHGRVLLMDDDAQIRAAVVKLLEALGYEADVAADGEAAVAAYRRALDAGRPYDVVILDLTVRGGVGGEVAVQRLRAIDPGVCAVVSSGYSDSAAIADPAAHGFVATLGKPYTLDDLRATLASAMAERQRRTAGDGARA